LESTKDGRLYCIEGGHFVDREEVQIAEILVGRLLEKFGDLTGTKHRKDLSYGDMVLMEGSRFDIILPLSANLVSTRFHEVLGFHLIHGKPVKAIVCSAEVPQSVWVGLFSVDAEYIVSKGDTITESIPDEISDIVSLCGETWRTLFESFQQSGLSPNLETMCAGLKEATSVPNLENWSKSREKGKGLIVEDRLFMALRRVFPFCVPMNPSAIGEELPDGYVFTVGSKGDCFFYDSKARIDQYNLNAEERRKLDTYFQKTRSVVKTHEFIGGCLISSDYNLRTVENSGAQLTAAHNLPVVLLTYKGIELLSRWTLNPVMQRVVQTLIQPDANMSFARSLFRPECFVSSATYLKEEMNIVRGSLSKRNADLAGLAAIRIHYVGPELLMSYALAVSFNHVMNPIETELRRFQLTTDNRALTFADSLKKALPPDHVSRYIETKRPARLSPGGIVLPVEAMYLVCAALSKDDSAYRDVTSRMQGVLDDPL
jgi:hypothetical protein